MSCYCAIVALVNLVVYLIPQADLGLMNPPASASRMLGFQACTPESPQGKLWIGWAHSPHPKYLQPTAGRTQCCGAHGDEGDWVLCLPVSLLTQGTHWDDNLACNLVQTGAWPMTCKMEMKRRSERVLFLPRADITSTWWEILGLWKLLGMAAAVGCQRVYRDGWRDGLVPKSTNCSYRGLEFGSQHPQGSSWPSITPVPKIQCLVWAHTCEQNIGIHLYMYSTYTHKECMERPHQLRG